MNTAEYPMLGTKVKYLRADEKGKIFDGEGNVCAIYLDPNKRVMVQVKDGDNAYNVDFFGLNPTADTRKAYEKVIKEVTKITESGNKLVEKTVSEHNDKVSDAYTATLGAPVTMEE